MFASEQELKELKDWVETNKRSFTPNGIGRQFGVFNNLGYPEAALSLREKIIKTFSLEGVLQEPLFKDYCGYITEGGAIHPHLDPNVGKLVHTRFNVLISKPLAGGTPIQEDQEIKVEEGDVWRCDAGKILHWCTPVVGNKPRIVLSFGFLLKE
jgi:hypothetical protein